MPHYNQHRNHIRQFLQVRNLNFDLPTFLGDEHPDFQLPRRRVPPTQNLARLRIAPVIDSLRSSPFVRPIVPLLSEVDVPLSPFHSTRIPLIVSSRRVFHSCCVFSCLSCVLVALRCVFLPCVTFQQFWQIPNEKGRRRCGPQTLAVPYCALR